MSDESTHITLGLSGHDGRNRVVVGGHDITGCVKEVKITCRVGEPTVAGIEVFVDRLDAIVDGDRTVLAPVDAPQEETP